LRGENFGVVRTVVPGLQNNVLGNVLSSDTSSSSDNILPHDNSAILLVLVDRQGLVNIVLTQVSVVTARISLEELGDKGGEIVTTSMDLIETNVEVVISEDSRQFIIDRLDGLVGTRVQDIKLTWVRLDGGVKGPDVV